MKHAPRNARAVLPPSPELEELAQLLPQLPPAKWLRVSACMSVSDQHRRGSRARVWVLGPPREREALARFIVLARELAPRLGSIDMSLLRSAKGASRLRLGGSHLHASRAGERFLLLAAAVLLALALLSGCRCWEPCGSDPECVIGFDAGTDAGEVSSDAGGDTDAVPSSDAGDAGVSPLRSSCAGRCGMGHGSKVPSGKLCLCTTTDPTDSGAAPLCFDFERWCVEDGGA